MTLSPADAAVAAKLTITNGIRPPVQLTVTMGGRCRLAAMSQYGKAHRGAASPTLSGKDHAGVPLCGHAHAFYIPLDEDGDGRIDAVVVYTRAGLKPDELDALARVQTVSLGTMHDRIDLRMCAVASQFTLSRIGPAFGTSRTWASATPYVMPRHPKRTRAGAPKLDPDGNHRDCPEQQLLQEWRQRVLDEPSLAELRGIYPIDTQTLPRRWSDYQLRQAKEETVRPVGLGLGFRLIFTEPVSGPVALGYACHFGLGLFVPEPGDVLCDSPSQWK